MTRRLLVFAYACEPGRGSEPGAGWGVVQALATFSRGVVLVGAEHERAIERFVTENPDHGFRYEVVSEPAWTRWVKRFKPGWFVAYLAWLRAAERRARELADSQAFDAAHHATYSTYWLPSPVASLGLPSVWGPVGGAVSTPARLWPMLGLRGVVGEVARRGLIALAARVPATRRNWRSVDRQIVQNESTRRRCGHSGAEPGVVLNHALFTQADSVPVHEREGFVLWVSPLDARKGPRLAVEVLAKLDDTLSMVMAGDGPERDAVRGLAQKRGVVDRLDLLGWIPRSEVMDLMSRAGVVLLTGLREEGGLALAEALLAGAPTVVLGVGGADTIAANATDMKWVRRVAPSGVDETAAAMAAEVESLLAEALPSRAGVLLDRPAAVRSLEAVFDEVLRAPVHS